VQILRQEHVMLKLGMLGMWHSHADGLVAQIAAHPDEFSLVGCYDSNPAVVSERRKQWGPKIPDLRVYDTPEKLLAAPLDGVVVEGRVGGNLKLARLALERGYPVLLEKPAGTDLDDYKRLIDLTERKRLHIQMFYLFRSMTAVVEMIRQARASARGCPSRWPPMIATSRFSESTRAACSSKRQGT
jgi:predicted dehydrogenase